MRLFNGLRVFALSILVMFVLAACGGGGPTDPGTNPDPDPDPGGGIQQLGIVTADASTASTGGSDVTPTAVFIETSQALPSAFLADPYAQVEDTCTVFTLGEDFDFGGDFPVVSDFDFTFLSAGPTVTLESGSTVYATLDREEQTLGGETFVIYAADTADGSIPGTLPSSLNVTIPGDEFPAFSDESLPIAGNFQLNEPTSTTSIGLDTPFTWDDSNEDNVVVQISVTSNDFQTFVNCVVEDDGSFALADGNPEGLTDGFTGQLDSAGRTAFRITSEGDAALLLTTSSTQTFGFDFDF